jgi:hypothetical protein
MRQYLLITARERAGTVDGLNLFFGALLGANLGTLNSLKLSSYIYFITLLAGTVMTLRMISTSERRVYALLLLAVYVVLLVGFWTVPELHPHGLSEGDLHRTLATIGIWVASVVLLEVSPLTASEGEAKRSIEEEPDETV